MPYLACERNLSAYAVPGQVRMLGAIYGMGDDSFDPSTMEPTYIPGDLTPPADVMPSLPPLEPIIPMEPVFSPAPTLTPPPAPSPLLTLNPAPGNITGIISAGGSVVGATGQVISAANAYPRTLQPSAGLPPGAVGYNSAGQPINAAGQVVSVSWLDQSTIIAGKPNSTVLLYGGGLLALLALAGGGGFAAGRR
jgi:hypothetical protein